MLQLLKKLLILLYMSNPLEDYAKFLMLSQTISDYAAIFDPNKLRELGLLFAFNYPASKSRFVGSPNNPIYPEVILWKPDNINLSTGKAVLVACIETSDTIETSISKWKAISNLGLIFNLVVPSWETGRVKELLALHNIHPTNFYQYHLKEDKIHNVFKKVE